MEYIVYKTIHMPSQMFYIGFHSTSDHDVFDGYYGSGAAIVELLNKFPKKEFVRITLFVSSDHDEAFNKESEFVKNHYLDEKCINVLKDGGAYSPLSKKSKEERTDIAKTRIANHPETLPKNLGRKHVGVKLQNIQNSIHDVHTNTTWITDGINETRIKNINDIPKGWRLGRCDKVACLSSSRTHSSESKQKISNANVGSKVYNNGKKTIRVYANEKIPVGYNNEGFLKRKKPSNIGNIPYHDPITKKIIRLMPNDTVPNGYIKGTGKTYKNTKLYNTIDGDNSTRIRIKDSDDIPDGYYTGKELYNLRKKKYENKCNK